MQGLRAAILLMMLTLGLAGCGATSSVPGAVLVYTRVMTDREGELIPFRAHRVSDPDLFLEAGSDAATNYAAVELDYVLPTFMITFTPLPGPTIRHTKDLSKALPLLARELCGDNPVSGIERELDWETGERNIYVECQALFGESYDLDADSEPPTVRGTEIDPNYSLEYRVIFDRNGDPPETIVTLSPDGTREVNKPY